MALVSSLFVFFLISLMQRTAAQYAGCQMPTKCLGYITLDASAKALPPLHAAVVIAGITSYASFHCDGQEGTIQKDTYPYVTCGGLPICGTLRDSMVSLSLAPEQIRCLLANPMRGERCLKCDIAASGANGWELATRQSLESTNGSIGSLSIKLPSVATRNSAQAVASDALVVQVGSEAPAAQGDGNPLFSNVGKKTRVSSSVRSVDCVSSVALQAALGLGSLFFLLWGTFR